MIRRQYINSLSHKSGSGGVPVNEQKALELLKRAADLGNSKAQFNFGLGYDQGKGGLEVDKDKAQELWESAAKTGNVESRHMLGRSEFSKKNMIDAVRHWRIAAASGYCHSMNALITFFEKGRLSHKDLAKSLRARDKACLDTRSDLRDRNRVFMDNMRQTDEV